LRGFESGRFSGANARKRMQTKAQIGSIADLI